MKFLFLAGVSCLALAGAAAAQPAPATPAKPPPARPGAGQTVEGVTVTATAPPVRTSIDRQSYSVANDLQAATGSISDALRNVPSLDVDVQGNVSLRGDSNVTILIDGKPSGMFQGDNRGQALQNLPANEIDRVEVITNPSAAFDPNGSSGIINLITRKTRKPGANGSVRANLGSQGRQNAGVTGSYRNGAVTLSGDANLRHDSIKQAYVRERETLEPATGGFNRTEIDGTGTGRINLQNLRAGLDYDLDAKSRLSVELRYLNFDFADRVYETFDAVSAHGEPLRGYDRVGRQRSERPVVTGSTRFRRTFGDDHQLDIDLTRERIDNEFEREFTYRNRFPAGPDAYETLRFDILQWKTLAKIEYARPLGDGVKLKVGYSYDADDSDYDNWGARGTGPGAVTVDPALTNLFRFDQQVHAFYATYERPFGRLTALAGVRVEAVDIDLEQVTSAIRAENDDVSLYPSLHLNYALSDSQKLTASYSRRIQRPQPQDYNPFRSYQDPQNFREGNPDLKPQETDSYELGYQYRRNGSIYLATFYYRDVRDAVNDVTRDLGDGVFLTTRENIGTSRSAGLELVANGRITRDLTYNTSGNAFWTEIDAASLGFGSRKRDAVSLQGRANLSWQATDKDFLQLNGFLNGKRLTPQGHIQPMGGLNLGYRRKVNDQLSAVVTVQDLFGTIEFKRVIETPTLRDVDHYRPQNRGVFVGFTYTFGGGRQRDPGFDFGSGGAPTP